MDRNFVKKPTTTSHDYIATPKMARLAFLQQIVLILLVLRFGDAFVVGADAQKSNANVPIYGKYELCTAALKHYDNPFNISEVSPRVTQI